MNKLKPCPICGGEAFKTVETVEGFGDFEDYEIARIECSNPDCRLQLQDPDSPHSDKIDRRWSFRTPDTALIAHNTELKEVVEFLSVYVKGDYQGTQVWKDTILPRIQRALDE